MAGYNVSLFCHACHLIVTSKILMNFSDSTFLIHTVWLEAVVCGELSCNFPFIYFLGYGAVVIIWLTRISCCTVYELILLGFFG
jgi:hypothetical protein